MTRVGQGRRDDGAPRGEISRAGVVEREPWRRSGKPRSGMARLRAPLAGLRVRGAKPGRASSWPAAVRGPRRPRFGAQGAAGCCLPPPTAQRWSGGVSRAWARRRCWLRCSATNWRCSARSWTNRSYPPLIAGRGRRDTERAGPTHRLGPHPHQRQGGVLAPADHAERRVLEFVGVCHGRLTRLLGEGRGAVGGALWPVCDLAGHDQVLPGSGGEFVRTLPGLRGLRR